MKKWRKFVLAPLALLALLTPIGLWLPGLFGAGGAWGEWSARELGRITGYIPKGMKNLNGFWRAPAAGYAMAGARGGSGYLASALIGAAVVIFAGFIIGKVLLRNGKRGRKH